MSPQSTHLEPCRDRSPSALSHAAPSNTVTSAPAPAPGCLAAPAHLCPSPFCSVLVFPHSFTHPEVATFIQFHLWLRDSAELVCSSLAQIELSGTDPGQIQQKKVDFPTALSLNCLGINFWILKKNFCSLCIPPTL